MSLSSVRWSELWQCLSIHQDKSSYSYIYSESILVHLTFFSCGSISQFCNAKGKNYVVTKSFKISKNYIDRVDVT